LKKERTYRYAVIGAEIAFLQLVIIKAENDPVSILVIGASRN